MRHIDVDFGFCIKCGKRVESKDLEANDNNFKCSCGGSSIVIGDNFLRKFHSGSLLCTCSNDQFQNLIHLDYENLSKDVYKCTKCSNCITIDTYK